MTWWESTPRAASGGCRPLRGAILEGSHLPRGAAPAAARRLISMTTALVCHSGGRRNPPIDSTGRAQGAQGRARDQVATITMLYAQAGIKAVPQRRQPGRQSVPPAAICRKWTPRLLDSCPGLMCHGMGIVSRNMKCHFVRNASFSSCRCRVADTQSDL